LRFGGWLYFLVLGTTLIALPITAMLGATFVAYLLSGLAFCGALALVALVVANVSLGVVGAVRLLCGLAHPRLQA
jgi:hypothetical protein